MQSTPTPTSPDVVQLGATLHPDRWWGTTHASVSWDYPPSPAAYYNALLSRGASHSRFLRIAHSSTRHRLTTSPPSPPNPLDTPTSPWSSSHLSPLTSPDSPRRKPSIHLLPTHPVSLSRPCVNARPRSANPISHTLKRRKPQWPKPPHYHASLLRSPLSCRKGLFRAVLPPNQAVDFFRWDVLVGTRVSLSAACQEHDWTRLDDVDACVSPHVAERVLGPYEAAAGFFGWHGLGLDVTRRVQCICDEDVDDGHCWPPALGLRCDCTGKCRSSGLQFGIDEAAVEEGRARWARMAEELVGPPGLTLRSVVEDGKSGKVSSSSDLAPKGIVIDVLPPLSIPSRREEAGWDPDVDSSLSRLPRATTVSDEKRKAPPSGSNPGRKADSPSAWWHGPSPHRGPPTTTHLPPLRFLPSPSLQYGPPPLQFSAWLPNGGIASIQGHGYWYGAEPLGTPSAMTGDPTLASSLPTPPHIFATAVIPTPIHPTHSPRYRTKSSSGQDGYDKETETDHDHESTTTTTTTDSDPPPHTPATTSRCGEAPRLNGDDEVEVVIDGKHTAASLTIRVPDLSAPVKLLGRFTTSPSLSVLPDSPDSHGDSCESSEGAVVFPSLSESFCQASTFVSLSSPGVSAQTTPEGTLTPASLPSLSSSKELSTRPGLGDEEDSDMHRKGRRPEASACSVSSNGPAFTLNLCSPPSTGSRPGLRRDSQGFWEPMVPFSPSSSSSSLPLSPSESKMRSKPTAGWIGDKTGWASGDSFEFPEFVSSPSTLSAKSRSSSPGLHRVTSTSSTPSSSSRPTSFSSPTSTSAATSVCGESRPSSPSPPNGPSLVPPNPTSLLPAFLATATVKRKKASRTREIVDRLRSSSMDAGKGGVGLDGSLGWLASPSAGREVDGKLGKMSAGSDQAAGNHAAGGQPSPPPSSQLGTNLVSWVGTDSGKKDGRSKSSESGSSVLGGKGNGATQTVVADSKTDSLHTSSRTGRTTKPRITPFPILSVSQTPVSDITVTRQSQTAATGGHESVAVKPLSTADGPRMNAIDARSSGPQLAPGALHGSTLPSARPSLHLHPPPSHPTVHPQPVLAPPAPMLAVSTYPHPMYFPFAPYHLAPPHQGQQGQGTWLAVYPARPAHVHPLPAQTHVAPITGVSGMRHVSW